MTESRVIHFKEQAVPYGLIRSSRRRSIGFEVSHDGLTVRAPDGVSIARIERALYDRAAWIAAKLAKWDAKPRRAEPRFETDDVYPFLGGALRLTVSDLKQGVRTRITRQDDSLLVCVDPALEEELRAATVRRALERWFKREAEALYAPLIARHAAALGKPLPKLIVRSQKRRWGSCDARGVIRMNWRLIGAEERLIDYVCAHEAAHLVEANHSSRFWAVVERLMSDYRDRRKALRDTESTIAPF